MGGETTAGLSPEAGGERPGEAVPSPDRATAEMTEEQKMDELAAFEAIDSRGIIAARMEEAIGNETVVDPEEGLPYEDTGRVDPLAIVSSAIPKELRPPRSGETDYDEILDFLITAYGTALLDSVQIEVWSVMQMGLEKMVNMSVNQQLMTMPEGGSYPVDVGGATVMMTVSSASQSVVVITLSFNSGYTSVSKTKTFVPKD
ncbi:MAG: hypothetical protein A2Y63_04920 [Candidatus Riflebacteria bacterium RBG_13_59_9]|nr:MAG: hypothetical protein A2Y63_04920 [Candidatus Riflebacteria bacterium RBG_13_59_9]